ncbi:C2H2 finger domain-containing protein [Histoplasma capsulatum H143]|uniref:C2H2 finger domain-containing protein n=1 Tax=Ajellomyces capsulatus (strain H143) TaxID=544712 RepID=C6H3B7_AJECH|nr:C2H2 finger domain-containing protein [Histoplasma capsulatum H143]
MALNNVCRPSPARSTLPSSRDERIIYTPLHPVCAQSPSAPRTASLSQSPPHSYHRGPRRSILLRSHLPRVRAANLTGSNDTPLRQSLYEDPLDDTDEDLSDVPSDYGGSKQTKKLKLRARDRWQRYCAAKASEPAADPQWFDAEEALQGASAKDLHRFWNWVLGKLERGKGGRKLKGTKKTSSLKSDWKYFQGYYRKVTGNGISEKMSEDVRRGMRSLADKHGLDNQPRENIPVYIEDMVPFNQTILRTREKRFHLGLQRLLLCFYNMLGLFTVNRESAILNLRYKDLLLSVQRDPHGGPPVPTVDFRPEFIKRNLGMGKLGHSNTFVLPEIIFDVSLVFSPHVFLFGFLFHAEAFENSSLRSMEDVRKLVPADGCQELPLPLKQEMDNWYIFCKVDVQDGQVRILRDTPMSAGTLDSQLKSMSEIHGFHNTFFSHQFRYGGGKLLDESGE